MDKFQIIVLSLLGMIACVIFAGVGLFVVYFLGGQERQQVQVSQEQDTAPLATNAPAPTVSPTKTPTLQLVSEQCQLNTKNYLAEIEPKLEEFFDTAEIADSTPRMALASIVTDLQRIRREVEQIPPPSCATRASQLLTGGMDGGIKAYLKFLGDSPDYIVEDYMAKGALDIENGAGQLIALAEGRATPEPKSLPTPTSTWTPVPTVTPMPLGSTIRVDNWDIRVIDVKTDRELSSTVGNNLERASGRFVVLILKITNRGLSPDTFVPIGNLLLQSETGRVYNENMMASLYAEWKYGLDSNPANLNPDESTSVAFVVDVPLEDQSFVLTSGHLVNTAPARLRVNVP